MFLKAAGKAPEREGDWGVGCRHETGFRSEFRLEGVNRVSAPRHGGKQGGCSLPCLGFQSPGRRTPNRSSSQKSVDSTLPLCPPAHSFAEAPVGRTQPESRGHRSPQCHWQRSAPGHRRVENTEPGGPRFQGVETGKQQDHLEQRKDMAPRCGAGPQRPEGRVDGWARNPETKVGALLNSKLGDQ